MERYPESVKALHDAGHEVMTHSDDHAHFAQLSPEQIRDNINASCDKIEAVIGMRPKLFRCPYGEYNDTVIETLTGMGMYTIQWDVDSLDWKELPAAEITKRVTEKVQSGSIVLFHNAAKHTPAALPGLTKQPRKKPSLKLCRIKLPFRRKNLKPSGTKPLISQPKLRQWTGRLKPPKKICSILPRRST